MNNLYYQTIFNCVILKKNIKLYIYNSQFLVNKILLTCKL